MADLIIYRPNSNCVLPEWESDMLPLYQHIRSRLSEHVGLAGNIFTSNILKYVVLSEFSPILDVQTCL